MHIPAQFVACFTRYQNRVKVNTFSIAAWYLLLISLHSLRVQCLVFCTQHAFYHSITGIKCFIFQENFHFLVKTITDSVRLRVVCLNLVLSTVNRVMFCEIYLQSVANITTIHDLLIYFIFKFFKRSSIPDSPSPILDPYFPVYLKVLLIKIILFFLFLSSCSKVINAFKR